MLSFHVKFVQKDGQMDRQTTVKLYAPNLSIQGHKNVGKGEIAGNQHFLLFPQHFKTHPFELVKSQDCVGQGLYEL